jgi:RNA polymerase sigma-70 factor, ECF subfamily
MVQYLDDKLVVNKLKAGDVLSFDYIFRKYNKKVYYFAISYLKNKEESEDVVQEVFMNLWRYRDQINEYYVFSKYLFRITYNETCKKFRKQASDKRQSEEVLKTFIYEDNSTSLDIEYNSLLENVNLHIEKLPLKQKEIILLSINDHLTTEQIAQMLNISKKTVENYLAMAKTSLRKTFSESHILSGLFFLLLFR